MYFNRRLTVAHYFHVCFKTFDSHRSQYFYNYMMCINHYIETSTITINKKGKKTKTFNIIIFIHSICKTQIFKILYV